MYNTFKKGDLIRYRHHYHHGLFVVIGEVCPTSMWMSMLSLRDGKEYVDLHTSMEKICEKKLDKSSDRVNG